MEVVWIGTDVGEESRASVASFSSSFADVSYFWKVPLAMILFLVTSLVNLSYALVVSRRRSTSCLRLPTGQSELLTYVIGAATPGLGS